MSKICDGCFYDVLGIEHDCEGCVFHDFAIAYKKIALELQKFLPNDEEEQVDAED